MMNGSRWIRGTLVILMVAGAIGCGRLGVAAFGSDQKKDAAPQVQVTTIRPARTNVNRTCSQPAFVAAFQETPLQAKISGYVEAPKVDIGDRVLKDQILAELRVPELVQELKQKESLVAQAQAERAQAESAVVAAEAAIASAKAKIEEAEATVEKAEGEFVRWKAQLDRDQQLVQDRTIQQKVVDETRNQFRAAAASRLEAAAKVKSAQANLGETEAKRVKAQADVAATLAKVAVATDDQARTQAMLDYSKIRAPFDGLVSQRNVDTGHFIPTGGTTKPLFVVVGIDTARVFLDVPEKDAISIKAGQRATVRVEALGSEEFQGTVTRFSWTLDPATRTMRTEIDVPNPDNKLRPGMYAYAHIVVEEHSDVLALPATAIIKQGDKTLCGCVVGGKVVRKPIKTGLGDSTLVEVVSGLTGDEEVISTNAASLSEGQRVQTAASKP